MTHLECANNVWHANNVWRVFLEPPLPCPVVVTITGCGGKTTLLWKLAEEKRGEKTLVTTTTHIGRPPEAENRYDYFWNEEDVEDVVDVVSRAERGVTLAGSTAGGKFASLPLETLEKIIPLFDYVFMEGDGSRTLPLKAWADYEPVVTSSTNITIGVLPLWTLGMAISDKIIHRLPIFCELTGARAGEPLEAKHFVSVITGGLFKGARGRKILFFNQVEDEKTLRAAREITALLPPDFARGLHRALAGSLRDNKFTDLPLGE
jgi:probable selenium-dependent hydroxylase accessory protein YqeC